MRTLQFLALVLAVIIVANFFLLLFQVINPLVFWLVLISVAIVAYKVLPKIKKAK